MIAPATRRRFDDVRSTNLGFLAARKNFLAYLWFENYIVENSIDIS